MLYVSYWRVQKIMEIFTVPKESICIPKLNLGVDISPVYFSSSRRTDLQYFMASE